MHACVHPRKLDRYICTFVSVLPPHKLILTPIVLVCLSADWAGALVLFNSFLFGFVFRLASCLTIDCLASCFLGLFLVCCFSLGGVLGPVMCGLFASACSGCPFVSGVLWSLWFLFVVSRVPVGLLFLLLSFPRLLCSALLLVCGVASAWLALSLLRSPPCSARPLG